MTNEQMQELVKECGLDWHRGFMPLFDGDPTNRYAVLIEAAVAIERERCAALCDAADKSIHPSDLADVIRATLPLATKEKT